MRTKDEVTQVIKGLNTDIDPNHQSQGTYRYAKNAVNKTSSGDIRMLSTENANALCVDLGLDYIIIGSRYINNEDIVFFATSRLNDDFIPDIIGILHKNCKHTKLVNADLGFDKSKQIDVEFRIRNGCERVVYFTDGKNNLRYFNLDKPYLFKDDDGSFNPDKFNLIRNYNKIPFISDVKVLNGGSLPNGAAKIGIRYVTEDGITTNVVNLSNQINLYNDSPSSPYNVVHGSNNGFKNMSFKKDIVSLKLNSNKSIKVIVENLDTDFLYYQLIFYIKSTDENVINQSLITEKISIKQNEYVFHGNESSLVEVDPNELLLNKLDIYRAEHIEQIENRLVIANVKGKEVDFCSFQRLASKVKVNYIVKQVPSNLIKKGNVKDPTTPFDHMTFMGDEVVALGIVYVYPDGYETMVYHIPGRASNNNDMTIIDVWTPNIKHLYEDEAAYNNMADEDKLRKWQVENTCNALGQLGYHQTKYSKYEEKRKCKGLEYWGRDSEEKILLDTPVRHHRIPSRQAVPLVGEVLNPEVDGIISLKITIDVEDWPREDPGDGSEGYPIEYCKGTITYINKNNETVEVYFSFRYDEANYQEFGYIDVLDTIDVNTEVSVDFEWSDFTDNSVVTKELTTEILGYSDAGIPINLIGLEFDNIEYPDGAIGHYIVTGIRDESNRTIWDKGIASELRQNDHFISFSWFQNRKNLDTWVSQRKDMFYSMYPKAQYHDEPGDLHYVHVEGKYTASDNFPNHYTTEVKQDVMDGSSSNGIFFGLIDTDKDGMSWILGFRWTNYIYNNTLPIIHNFPILDNFKLRGGESIPAYADNKILYNTTLDNNVQIFKSSNNFVGENYDINYVSLKVNNDVYPNPFNIKYRKISNKLENGNTKVYGGDTYISRTSLSATSYYETDIASRWWETAINIIALIAITALSAGTLAPFAAGIAIAMGVIGVTAEIVAQFMKDVSSNGLKELIFDSKMREAIGRQGKKDDLFRYFGSHISGIFIESEIPIGLRSKADVTCQSFFSYGYGRSDNLKNYFTAKWIKPSKARENKDTLSPLPCPEIYLISRDYEISSSLNVYYSLPFEFDCCSDCMEHFPNRVYYSDQSFQEGISDHYSIFRPNNYRDIEANYGAITDLFVLNNSLHIHTERALFKLPHNLQEKVTDELITYIGTGSFFSIPPMKVIDSELGSGGCIHKWATRKHNGKVYFISYYDRKVYMYSSQGSLPISQQGLDKFFEKNTELVLNNQYFEYYNENIPLINNPANPEGIGYHAVIDETHDRYILTKRDFKLNNSFFDDKLIECKGKWWYFNDFDNVVSQHIADGWSYMGLDENCKLKFQREVEIYEQIDNYEDLDIHILHDFSGSFNPTDRNNFNVKIYNWASSHNIPTSRIFTHSEIANLLSYDEQERWMHNISYIKASYGSGDEWKGKNIMVVVLINESSPAYYDVTYNGPVFSYSLHDPKPLYLSDRDEYLDFENNLNYLNTVIYPVFNTGLANLFILSTIAGIEGVNMTPSEIEAKYSKNDFIQQYVWDNFLQEMSNNPYVSAPLDFQNININETLTTIPTQEDLNNDLDSFMITDSDVIVDVEIETKLIPGVSKEIVDFVECSNSFTLSYSLDKNWGWISWHSYIPLIYMNNKKDFYSMAFTREIYKHNQLGKYITYYNEAKEFIVEFTFKGQELKQFISQSLMFDTDSELYDFEREMFFDERNSTFNKFYAYNSRQFTGLLKLVSKDAMNPFLEKSVIDDIETIEIDRNERFWNINDYRDLIINPLIPFFKKSCKNNNLHFTGNDKDIVIESFDYNKNWNEQEVMRDKFITFRFILDNSTNTRLTVKSFIHKKQTSER